MHYSRPMPTTSTTASDWTPERIDRLARAMYPLIFGCTAPAPAPAADNVVELAHCHRPARRLRPVMVAAGGAGMRRDEGACSAMRLFTVRAGLRNSSDKNNKASQQKSSPYNYFIILSIFN